MEQYALIKIGEVIINIEDSFEIVGSCGYALIKIKRPDGTHISYHCHIADGTGLYSKGAVLPFEPESLSVPKRRSLIWRMLSDGIKGKDIAELLGISRQRVYHDLKIMRKLR